MPSSSSCANLAASSSSSSSFPPSSPFCLIAASSNFFSFCYGCGNSSGMQIRPLKIRGNVVLHFRILYNGEFQSCLFYSRVFLVDINMRLPSLKNLLLTSFPPLFCSFSSKFFFSPSSNLIPCAAFLLCTLETSPLPLCKKGLGIKDNASLTGIDRQLPYGLNLDWPPHI